VSKFIASNKSSTNLLTCFIEEVGKQEIILFKFQNLTLIKAEDQIKFAPFPFASKGELPLKIKKFFS